MKKNVWIVVAICLMFLIACGKEPSIEGKWVMTQHKNADGTVIKGDDLEVYECYEVNGDTATYTCIAKPLGEKSFELQVEKISDNEYCFKISDTLVFSTVKLDGKKFTYTIGEGENETLLVFEKK